MTLLCKERFGVNWKGSIHITLSSISPYTIFASYLLRTPDMQAETGQPIYFWNRLLKAVVLQKTDFYFFVLPFMQPERGQKLF